MGAPATHCNTRELLKRQLHSYFVSKVGDLRNFNRDEDDDEEDGEKKEKKDKKEKKESKEKEGRDENQRMHAAIAATSNSSHTHNDGRSGSGGAKAIGTNNTISQNLYVPHSATKSLSAKAIAAYRAEVDIVVHADTDADAFSPLLSFEYLWPSTASVPEIRTYCEGKKFTKPSPIQSQCWPPLLSGRDVIGIAATGSGKTMSFLVPALLKIHAANTPGVVQMLVLAPTRELAMQSDVVCRELAQCGTKGGRIARSVCIYGGVSKGEQKSALRSGVEVVVATPGRLLDLVEERAISLANIRYLVLDEADRMLDEGFLPAIKSIVGNCPTAEQGRQTVMFSATWPEEIRRLAASYLKADVVRVVVGGDELSANHRVTQVVECIDKFARDRRLGELLTKYHNKQAKNRCLIFVLYKREATTILNLIQSKGYSAGAIHGDMKQEDRTKALEQFKLGNVPLLIATDVAARGLDIPQVEYVLNYSFPLTVEDYVHRIGRTGRGGSTGVSHTFFTDDDKGLAGALVGVLQQANQEVPKEIYKYPLLTKKKSDKLYGDFGPKADLVGKTSTKITFDD